MKNRILANCLTLLAAGMLMTGCGTRKDKTPKADAIAKKSEPEHDGHGDHGEGPHGGAVADWGGGKYHIEFTVDHDKQEATVYILGSDETTPAPIKTKDGKLLLTIKEPAFQTDLLAASQKGDPEGKASAFTGKHKNLGIVREFAGTVSAELDGTPYAGDFKEEPHQEKKKKK